MLVEFSVANFLSFREEQRLSLVAAKKRASLDSSFEVPALGKERLLRSAVIYGPNASGKSNLFKALSFVRDLVTSSPERRPESGTGAQPFRLSTSTRSMPSRFEVSFVQDGVRYEYHLLVSPHAIHEETLYAYPKNRPQRWYSRTHDSDHDRAQVDFGSGLKGATSMAQLVRPDVPFLSVAARFSHAQLAKVYQWFSQTCTIMPEEYLSFVGGMGTDFAGFVVASVPEVHPALGHLLQKADLGIQGFTIRERDQSLFDIPRMVRGAAAERLLQSLGDAERQSLDQYRDLEVAVQHQGEQGSPPFALADESRGTRQVFVLGPLILASLRQGNVLLIDELDASLHPQLVRTLVELFHRENPNNAQLIFNTHDASLLRGDLFDRDQIWFIEKDRQGASQLYPLLDFRELPGEDLELGYLRGRYGAVPLIDRLTWEELRPDAAAS